MSDAPQGPPSAGWYALGGNSDDLVYFDGRAWTWRRWRLPGGEWRQERILPPSAGLPQPAMSSPTAVPPPGAAPTGRAPLQPGGGQPSADRPPTAGSPLQGGTDWDRATGSPEPRQPGSAGAATPPGWGGGTGSPGSPPYGAGPHDPGRPLLPGGPTYPGGPGGPWSGGPSPSSSRGRLDLFLSEPQRQARWKTLLRIVLVLPNAIVLGALGIAVAFVTVVMWFATLFMGRVPEGMWRFSKGVLQWAARTDAYMLFLTGRYPPFRIGDAHYPVTMTLDRPERFNRLAVLFRLILVIPAGIVVSVFGSGVYVFSFITWLVTLVLGRCPRSLHLMLAAWLRYQLRYSAYLYLLTTAYPSAPLGDKRPTYGSLESGAIVLRGASKAFAVIAIVLGPLLYLSDIPVVLSNRSQAQAAITQLDALQSRSTAAGVSFRAQVGACANTWRCVERGTSILEQSLQTQISTIEAIHFPTDPTRHDARALLLVLREEGSAVSQMQGAGTVQTFQSDLNHVATLTRQLQPLALQLHDDLERAP